MAARQLYTSNTYTDSVAGDSTHGDELCGCLINSRFILAQYLNEDIAGAQPTFMKVKIAFVALAIPMLHMGSRDRSSNDATTR